MWQNAFPAKRFNLRTYVFNRNFVNSLTRQGFLETTPKVPLMLLAVADMDPIGFFVATPNGMGDNKGGMGSFNCSKTNGPLGPPCDTDRAK